MNYMGGVYHYTASPAPLNPGSAACLVEEGPFSLAIAKLHARHHLRASKLISIIKRALGVLIPMHLRVHAERVCVFFSLCDVQLLSNFIELMKSDWRCVPQR